MLTFTTGSTHPVAQVAFHPNGSTVVVGQPNHGITLFDRGSGQITGNIAIPRVADYISMVLCGGGSKVAISSLRGLFVFDLASGKLLFQHGSYGLANSLLAEREGELIAAVHTGGVRKINLAPEIFGEKLFLQFQHIPSRATIIAASPCGRWGFGIYGRVRLKPPLLNLLTGRVAMAVDHPCADTGRADERPRVTFAPNGARFAVCGGNDVTVYDTPEDVPDDGDDDEQPPDSSLVQRAGPEKAPKPRGVLQAVFRLAKPEGVRAEDRWLPAVAFTPDAKAMLVRRPRNRVQLWDVATASHLGEWSWRLDSLTCLAVAPDGLTAVAGARFGRVVVWDLE